MSALDYVSKEISQGRWRRTGRVDERGFPNWYDIGLTFDDIALCARVDEKHLDKLLRQLIEDKTIIFRASQKRYVWSPECLRYYDRKRSTFFDY